MVSASNREPLCHCRENNYLPCGSSKQNRSLNLTQILQSVQAIKYSLQINHLLDSGGQTFTHNDCYNRAKTVTRNSNNFTNMPQHKSKLSNKIYITVIPFHCV